MPRRNCRDSLTAVPDKVKALAELFPQRLAEISDIAQNADASTLIPAFPNNMTALIEVDAQRRLLRSRWKEVNTALTQAGSENAEKNTAVLNAILALDKKVDDDVLKKLNPWMNVLATHAKTESAKTVAILPNLIADPVMHSPQALTLVSSASAINDELLRVIDGWTKLNAQLQGVTITGFDMTGTSQAAKALTEANRALNINITVVQDGLTGDASQFIADQVSLYYFTDVERIMKMLNSATYEIGGLKGARTRRVGATATHNNRT